MPPRATNCSSALPRRASIRTAGSGRQLIHLVREILGFPRHLSQHVGGMVLTRLPLCEIVPIENASMPGRTVVEWDKDDLDALGILKVDCLALGMLSAIRRCLDLIKEHTGQALTLATIPAEDPAVYAMIQRADTVGVFQIESRAQMSMLPRLKPNKFYDLVDRGGDRAPGSDPGKDGPSLPAAAQWRRAGGISQRSRARGPRENTGGAALSGAGDEAGGRGGGFHSG